MTVVRHIWLPAVVLSFTLPQLAAAQEQRGDARTLVGQWLMTSCSVGEDPAITRELQLLGGQAVPALIAAFSNGLPDNLTDEMARAAGERFERRSRVLASSTTLAIDPESLARARRVTREDYIARVREDVAFGYRAEALRALGIVGGSEAESFLQGIARDPESPFNAPARLALEAVRSKG